MAGYLAALGEAGRFAVALDGPLGPVRCSALRIAGKILRCAFRSGRCQYVNDELHTKDKQITRLESKLFGIRKVAEAKSILMETRGITDREAYRVIREQAMTRRVSTEEIANATINANSILSFKA
jgi:hypothetical protein